MTLQAHNLFIHTDFICINRNFCQQAALVCLDVAEQLLYPLGQFLTVFRNNLRRTLFNKIHIAFHLVELCAQIGL